MPRPSATDRALMMDRDHRTRAVGSIVQRYDDAFGEHGNSLSAMLIPKDRQRERFDSLTRPFSGQDFTVLDFGCGLAHLKDYLDARHPAFQYVGVDVVPAFIDENRRRHPEARFEHVHDVDEVEGVYDYVVLCGVFNLRYGLDEEGHRAILQHILTTLFARTRRALCVNFLSDAVDYRHPDAFHENPLEAYAWARDVLSPRLLLDHAYMPYEFSLLVFKDAEILRPGNVYRHLPHD